MEQDESPPNNGEREPSEQPHESVVVMDTEAPVLEAKLLGDESVQHVEVRIRNEQEIRGDVDDEREMDDVAIEIPKQEDTQELE